MHRVEPRALFNDNESVQRSLMVTYLNAKLCSTSSVEFTRTYDLRNLFPGEPFKYTPMALNYDSFVTTPLRHL